MIDNNINNLKPLNFVLVLCKTRKKFDKYVKINKIRNKYVVDINKMLIEENLKYNEIANSNVFKLLILKKFNMAKEKKKDIYYIPLLNNNIEVSKFFNIKDIIDNTHNFNLMYFYEDFEPGQQPIEILNRINDFDISQILKDY